MSRIDELIRQYAPDGVEYIELAQLFDTRNGYTPSKTDKSAWSDGTVPWFRMEDIRENGRVLHDSIQRISQTAVKGGRLFPANSILVATSATIGEHALVTVPHLSNQRFTSLSIKPQYEDQFDIRFVFYYCFVLDEWCRSNTTVSSFASVDMVGFKKFRFPVPPLEVQREIVRILDTFTELEAELEAELQARRAQYAHYRDALLSFTERERVRWIPVSDLGTWTGGVTPSKSNPRFWDEGTIPWLASMDVSASMGPVTSAGIRGRVTGAALDETPVKIVEGPTIAVVMRSNVLRRFLPIAYVDADTTVNQDIRLLKPAPGIVPRYAYQVLQVEAERLRSSVVRTDGSMAAVDSKGFFDWRVPVPDADEQERIAAMLDRFDALVNDLSSGLPAEIEARRQQYAYYRDRLLTFKEAV